MSETRTCGYSGKESVGIDVNRIMDSCRDKDCYEDVRVYLTEYGQDIIEKTCNIRFRYAKIVWAQIGVSPVQFNRGFYQATIRFYVKLLLEACLAPGKTQDFEGIAVVEKKVILYGGEGCVNVFRSTPGESDFCGTPGFSDNGDTNLPVVVCEVADPIVLDLKVVEKHHHCCCCCSVDEVPDRVCDTLSCQLSHMDECKRLVVTLGFFSIIRMERPGQYLVSATEICVPDKVCVDTGDSNPCAVFSRMPFPTSEFCPIDRSGGIGCGCEAEGRRK